MKFLPPFRIANKINPLAWYAAVYGGSAVILKGSGFVLFIWLARSLSIEDYARFGLLYALQTGLATFSCAGILESVTGLLKEHKLPHMQSKLFCAANAAFLLMSVVSAILTFIFWSLVKPTNGLLLYSVIFGIVAGILSAFSTLQANFERLKEKHIASLSFSFFVPLAGFVGGFIGFLIGQTILMFFFGFALGMFLSLLVIRMYGVGSYGVLRHIKETPLIFRHIAPFIIIAFLGWLSGYGNNFCIKWFFASEEIARFTFAFTLASTLPLVASSLNQVWNPRFYQIVHEQAPDEVERKNGKFFRLQSLAMGLVGGLLIACFPVAIHIIGKNLIAYKGMQTDLLLLFAGYIVLTPWWHCNNYYLVNGKGNELLNIVSATSFIGVVVWLLFMWVLGPIGIYLGFPVQMLVRVTVIVISAKKHWPVRIAWDGVAVGILLLTAGFIFSVSGIFSN